MATCNRCSRRLDPQSVDTVFGSGGALYCSPCAHVLYAQQQSPDLTRAALSGGLAALLGLGAWGILSFMLVLHSEGALLLVMSFPASFIGLAVGMAVHRGSGRKRGRALQWTGGIIAGIALIVANAIIGSILNAGGVSPFIPLICAVVSFVPGVYGALKPVSPPYLAVSNPEQQKLQPFQPPETPPPAEPDIDEPLSAPVGGVTSAWSVFGNMVVMIFILMILASFLIPVFAKAREKARSSGCPSNVKQLALAIQMYANDHGGQYPGIDGGSWVSKIAPYVGNSRDMFLCPSDKSGETDIVSYAMSGLLIREDGSGVKESQIFSPSEVGSLVDSSPNQDYPDSRLIGGAPLQDYDSTSVEIDYKRHNKGTIVGFVDGHAKYFVRPVYRGDTTNEAVRAFSFVSPLGLVDNPIAGVPDFTVGRTSADTITIGGEYCTRSLLMAAGEAWEVKAKAPWYTYGFNGQYDTANRPADYLWGTGDGRKPAGNAIPIARDAVVVIVSKGSRITLLPALRNASHLVDYPTLRRLFSTESARSTVQVYTMGESSGTRQYLADRLGEKGKRLKLDKKAAVVANDREMIEKVNRDPHAIGYCSSAFADPDRIVILALKTPGGKTFYYPQKHKKHRWVVPNSPDWPWTRTLYAEYGGAAWKADSSGIANVMLAPGRAGTEALRQGPLFGTGLWTPE